MDSPMVQCPHHGVYHAARIECPVCVTLGVKRCPVPDAPDELSASPIDSRSQDSERPPTSYTATPPDLIQALQANTRAQLELSKAICQLVQSISQLIDSGTVDDGDDVDDLPSVGLDGQPIPRN